MKKTAIVIPAFNEAVRIGEVLAQVSQKFPHVIVVDDGSKDSTQVIAQSHTPHVLVHSVNVGKGGAMRTGAEYAFEHLGLQRIIYIDGDGQHNPQELDLFLKRFQAGDNIVFGVRDIWRNMPRSRGIGNHLVSQYVQWRYGVYVPDILSGFKGFTRQGYEAVKWQARGYEVELEIAVKVAEKRLHFSTVDIETIYHDFDRGMNVLDALRLIGKLPLWK